MREFEHLLPTLDPPSGGMARLRRHVARRPSRPRLRRRWAWVPAVAVGVAVLAVWGPPWLSRRHQAAALTTALREAMLEPMPGNGIRVADGAAVELPSGQAGVRLYLVQTSGGRAPSPRVPAGASPAGDGPTLR